MNRTNYKIYFTLLFALLLFSACSTTPSNVDNTTDDDSSAALLLESQICVMVDGQATRYFDQETEQIVCTSDKSLYSVSNMEYTTQYTLEFNGVLLLNNIINVDYSATNIPGLSTGSASMTIIKIDSSDKRYWLYDNDLKLGFVVDFSL